MATDMLVMEHSFHSIFYIITNKSALLQYIHFYQSLVINVGTILYFFKNIYVTELHPNFALKYTFVFC